MPALDIGQVEGLTDREAEEKLRSEGYNELPAASRRGAVRAMAFSAIAVSVVRSQNPALLLVFAGTLLCLSLVLCVPGLQDLFRFGPLSPFEILVSAGAGVLSVLWFEWDYVRERREG